MCFSRGALSEELQHQIRCTRSRELVHRSLADSCTSSFSEDDGHDSAHDELATTPRQYRARAEGCRLQGERCTTSTTIENMEGRRRWFRAWLNRLRLANIEAGRLRATRFCRDAGVDELQENGIHRHMPLQTPTRLNQRRPARGADEVGAMTSYDASHEATERMPRVVRVLLTHDKAMQKWQKGAEALAPPIETDGQQRAKQPQH
mmetsp:Transcript_46679/g.99679  ORF Transcript_46679/g.99679 Transcript_46679/m.99679 type:complete len:205 (+) Transcript_46679:173-787(+)